MKAAVLTKLNIPLEIMGNIEYPEPGPGQVLVKLAYSGVCRSQLMEQKRFERARFIFTSFIRS